MAEENYYDLVDITKEVTRKPQYAVYGASRKYSDYLQGEGLISAGEQVVVKTSSCDLNESGTFPKDEMDELLRCLRNQHLKGVFPTVLHWIVAFSVPAKEWGVPLPQSEYKTPYHNEDGALIQDPTDHHYPFVIDSHRYGQVSESVHHVFRLTNPIPGTNEWKETEYATYPISRPKYHLRALNKLIQDEHCVIDCVYWAIRKNERPSTW